MKLPLNSWKTNSVIDIKILIFEFIFKCSYDTNVFIFSNLQLMLTLYDMSKYVFSNIGVLFWSSRAMLFWTKDCWIKIIIYQNMCMSRIVITF